MGIGLYIHIPFCKQICTYCDFPKRVSSQNNQKLYIDSLINELQNYKDRLLNVDSIYIGGGTPSSLSLRNLEKLLIFIDNNIDTNKLREYSIESNPEDISYEFLTLISKYNINRLSIGVQTFNNKHLTFINRKQLPNMSDLISTIKSHNINNINVDMIFAIPNQSINELEDDIDKVTSLDITHISYYSLIHEEKTILDYQYKNDQIQLINQDLEEKMFKIVIKKLSKKFNHYEISNFSKTKDYESYHNKIYWKNNKYIGIGYKSHGYINNVRYSNQSTFKEYLNKTYNYSKDQISIEDDMYNELMLGLRLIKGINITRFNKKFNVNINEIYPIIDKLIEQKLLKIENNHLLLTKTGLFLQNEVLLRLLEGE